MTVIRIGRRMLSFSAKIPRFLRKYSAWSTPSMVMPPPLLLLFSSSSEQADIVIVVNTPAIASHITERTMFFIPNLFFKLFTKFCCKINEKRGNRKDKTGKKSVKTEKHRSKRKKSHISTILGVWTLEVWASRPHPQSPALNTYASFIISLSLPTRGTYLIILNCNTVIL